jgi:D-threo-aldose 1-dehydrogenase
MNTDIKQYKRSFDLRLPHVIFGTSGLGNLFEVLDDKTKYDIVRESIRLSKGTVVFDSAGKYGAGLALECLGKCLRQMNIAFGEVVICNKLGWFRTDLQTEEPTFEPGVWKGLRHDAIQKISYDGILECYEQGNALLDGYVPQMVSVHDPDEYLATAKDDLHAQRLYNDILGAYRALVELKQHGKVKSVGVGAKDWRVIQRIERHVELDWVMIANSMTIRSHPAELLDFISGLDKKGITVINSAVFHSGFLVGGNYFDYKLVPHGTASGDSLYRWREEFFMVCEAYGIKPATACVQFAMNVPGVSSIALNTTRVERVKENLQMANTRIPDEFWETLKAKRLIADYFFNNTKLLYEQ